MQSMWCHWSLDEDCTQPVRSWGGDPPLQGAKEKVVGSGENLMAKYKEVHRTTPIVEVDNDGSKTQKVTHEGSSWICSLDCGAAKNLCGAKPVALMAQTCARERKRVGEERDAEAIDESYHFRGIGNQIVSSFMKLRVSGSIDGKEVSFAPSVTQNDIPPMVGNDHLIPQDVPYICIQMSVDSKSPFVELMQKCM